MEGGDWGGKSSVLGKEDLSMLNGLYNTHTHTPPSPLPRKERIHKLAKRPDHVRTGTDEGHEFA
jgi:hypothetical protein